MVFIEPSFQSYYGLVYLVQSQEIMSGCFVRSKEIEKGRDSVERKGVFGGGMGGEVEVGIRKDGFEGNVLLCHY